MIRWVVRGFVEQLLWGIGLAGRVAYVEVFEVGGEFETVGGYEVVGYCLHDSGCGGEAVDLKQGGLVDFQRVEIGEGSLLESMEVAYLWTDLRLETISLPAAHC